MSDSYIARLAGELDRAETKIVKLESEIERLKADYEIQMRKTDAAEAEIERLTGEINHAMLPKTMQEMVAMIVKVTPAITRAEALDMVEKAVAKVFNAAVP